MKKQLKNVEIGVSKHYQLYPGWENINGVAYTEASVAKCFANYLETEHGADVYITSGFNHVIDEEFVDIFADIYNFEFCDLSSDVAKLDKYGGLEIDRETMDTIEERLKKFSPRPFGV